jgi:hypothetical protein
VGWGRSRKGWNRVPSGTLAFGPGNSHLAGETMSGADRWGILRTDDRKSVDRSSSGSLPVSNMPGILRVHWVRDPKSRFESLVRRITVGEHSIGEAAINSIGELRRRPVSKRAYTHDVYWFNAVGKRCKAIAKAMGFLPSCGLRTRKTWEKSPAADPHGMWIAKTTWCSSTRSWWRRYGMRPLAP